MARKKTKGTELSVFKGREARLNRAILNSLALKGQSTIYDIHKEVRKQKGLAKTRYSSVNKRVRTLEKTGFLNKTAVKETKAGFKASIYELAFRAYLAMILNSINLDTLLINIDESSAQTIMVNLASSLYIRKTTSI
jgi:DNA-binding PadR family transcriptional regulator